MPHRESKTYPDIYEAINDCYEIEVIVDNNINRFDSNSDEYSKILNELNNMLEDSHEMPAFGVSLDNETKEAKKTGLWIELNYLTINTHNEMPFDSLLIEVQKDWSGFNIYRGNKGVYEGRCFYIDLTDNNMNNLYELLIISQEN